VPVQTVKVTKSAWHLQFTNKSPTSFCNCRNSPGDLYTRTPVKVRRGKLSPSQNYALFPHLRLSPLTDIRIRDVWGLTGSGKTVSHVKVPLTFGTVGATSGSDFRSGRPCDSMPVIEESRWVFLVCRWDVWGLTGSGKTVSHVKVPLTFGTVGATSGSDFRSGRPCDSMPVIEESRWVFLVCRWDVWGLTGSGKTVSHVKVPLTFGTVGATSGSDFRSGRPCDSMPVIEESRWVFFSVSGVDQGLRDTGFFCANCFLCFLAYHTLCGLGEGWAVLMDVWI
jgi:hypothetical protein